MALLSWFTVMPMAADWWEWRVIISRSAIELCTNEHPLPAMKNGAFLWGRKASHWGAPTIDWYPSCEGYQSYVFDMPTRFADWLLVACIIYLTALNVIAESCYSNCASSILPDSGMWLWFQTVILRSNQLLKGLQTRLLGALQRPKGREARINSQIVAVEIALKMAVSLSRHIARSSTWHWSGH